MGLLLSNNEDAVIWRGPMISGAVSQFLAMRLIISFNLLPSF
ncbi:MAG: hypothetical protein WCY18_07710 [Methanofastidiosum sp.]